MARAAREHSWHIALTMHVIWVQHACSTNHTQRAAHAEFAAANSGAIVQCPA
jgi:hypothetical protein